MRSHGHVTINAKKMSPSARDYRVRVRSTAESAPFKCLLSPFTHPTLLARNNTEDSVSVDIADPQVLKSCINKGLHQLIKHTSQNYCPK